MESRFDSKKGEQPIMKDKRMSGWSARWNRIKEWMSKVRSALEAGPRVRLGIGISTACLTLLTAFFIGGSVRFGIGPFIDPVIGTLMFLVLFAVFVLITVIIVPFIRIIARLFSWRAFLVLAGILGALVLMGRLYLIVVLPFFIVLTLLGAAAGGMIRGGFAEASKAKKVVLIATASLAAIGLVGLIVWMANRGSDNHLTAYSPNPVSVVQLQAEDPSQPGKFSVLTLTYGSGTDKRRTEFGEGRALTTEPVDATPFVKGSEGWRMKLRKWYWGFDFDSFPVNGRVWYPDGDGPFPLVLVVHGNHSMEEHSDPGYAWLGELMASRGFILVSVDENFFNGSWRGSLNIENDGRGWMLLRHLSAWREWNEGSDNPFAGKVDMDRIALIGHSRGGEAAAIAASFNRLERYPEDGKVELGGGFSIRAVIAIAPSDGQYTPAGQRVPLQDLSYLVIQGGHDADVSTFAGSRQWRRLRLSAGNGHFKASVWSYRSNHGQFNTVWGDADFPWPFSLLLNRLPLLTGEEQRRFGGVIMSAFLEAALNGRAEYRAVFRDLRSAAHWLPEDTYVTRYEDPGFTILADFENDVDLKTGSLEGIRINGTHLAVWREEHQSYRREGSKQNGVVVLGWRNSEGEEETGENGDAEPIIGRYTVELPVKSRTGLALDENTAVVFSIADTGDSPPLEDDEDTETDNNKDDAEDKEKGEDEDKDKDEKPEPVDLTIEMVLADGRTASIPLSSVRQLVPPLKSRFSKMPTEEWAFGGAWEPILQTVEIPLSIFIDEMPDFDPSMVSAISLLFDRTPEGMVIVDDIGFAKIQ